MAMDVLLVQISNAPVTHGHSTDVMVFETSLSLSQLLQCRWMSLGGMQHSQGMGTCSIHREWGPAAFTGNGDLQHSQRMGDL